MTDLYNGDCLDEMSKIQKGSIDLILTDLPYGTTNNSWDSIIPLNEMWRLFRQISKPTTNMVFTASQPFTSVLISSNLSQFRYEVIWKKTIGSGQLSINQRPLKLHESVLIFYEKFGCYNEQLTEGTPYKINRKLKKYGTSNYMNQKDHVSENNGTRRAKSIIEIPNPRIKGGHPTQKPLALMEHLIKTYSNEGDTILDCCMGSGTTGEACVNTKRNFIGIEKDKEYFDKAKERIG